MELAPLGDSSMTENWLMFRFAWVRKSTSWRVVFFVNFRKIPLRLGKLLSFALLARLQIFSYCHSGDFFAAVIVHSCVANDWRQRGFNTSAVLEVSGLPLLSELLNKQGQFSLLVALDVIENLILQLLVEARQDPCTTKSQQDGHGWARV
jgi:hypothetical protein